MSSEKPEMACFYNAIKSGVDNLDHLVRFYSCKKKTRCWPHRFFLNLLDVICVNSFVLFKKRHATLSRYSFLKELAHQLMRSLMKRRLLDSSSNRVRTAIRLFISPETEHLDSYSHNSFIIIIHNCTLCIHNNWIYLLKMTHIFWN